LIVKQGSGYNAAITWNMKSRKKETNKQHPPGGIKNNSFVPIDFNVKTNAFLVGSAVLFFLLVLFKINGSSVALWNNKGPANKDIDKENGLLLGNPKVIRIDEWARNTPFVFSQYQLGFPKKNPSMGAGNNAFPANMPVNDITTVFRPIYWGFFFLDIERGFAWYWNFRLILLLVGFFLMMMLLTKNNFLLSVFGAFWVLASSATQWWTSSYLPEMIAYPGLIFVAIVYIVFSGNWKSIGIGIVMFIVFSFSYVAVLYPPWQLLSGYLLLVLLVGYMLSNPLKTILHDGKIRVRAGLAMGSLLVLFLLVFHFYLELQELVTIMLHTVYPGSRVFAGGEMSLARLYSGYLFSFVKENNVPAAWYNICEASGYLLFFPGVIVAIFFSYFKGTKVPLLFWLLTGYILLMTTWALIGLPPLVAKLLLLSNVNEIRTSAFIGIANIILVLLYLNENKVVQPKVKPAERYVFLLIIFVFIYLILENINAAFTEKIDASKLFGLAIYFTLIHFFIFLNWNWSQLLFSLMLIPFLIPNLLINPVSTGLAPILKHPLYAFMNEVKQKYSDGRWVVFGQNSAMVANLLKATGVKVFGGTIVAPDIKEMEVLDDQKKFNNVYNRYSQCSVLPGNGQAEVEFTLPFGDATELHINPCSRKLSQINIKYALFLYQPSPQETQCMRLIENKNHFPVFMYVDSDTGGK
jgi:hypothetical protein